MGIGNAELEQAGGPVADLITPHGDWKPDLGGTRDADSVTSLPLMGIENHVLIRHRAHDGRRLITPHGD